MIRKTIRIKQKTYKYNGILHSWDKIRKTTYWFLFIPIFSKEEIMEHSEAYS